MHTEALILGTAQFGLRYGVANRAGQPDIGRVAEILATARAVGMTMLDTATAYGSSEAVLGACGLGGWSVISKVPSLGECADADIARSARQSVLRSLDRLKVDRLHGVLAHDSRDMIGPRGQALREALLMLRQDGLVQHIGVSVYGPDDLMQCGLEQIGIVQAPLNVFDQRFSRSPLAEMLRDTGTELHVRSVFLQGLLVMAAGDRPERFGRWAEHFARFDARLRDSGLDALAFCLGFAARQPVAARCVVGVETPRQVAQLAEALRAGQESDVDADDLWSQDPDLIDPRTWARVS
jgi:aryl-alcohol dehydrogenase-like predicted oxidoreductase